MSRHKIYLAGFPRSGTTWATWLLAGTLNCPAYGWSESANDFAAEGHERPNQEWGVYRGHFRPAEDGGAALARLNINKVREDGDYIVLQVRDPRDVAVSAAQYWGTDIDQGVSRVVESKNPANMTWQRYITQWLESGFPFALMQYEYLIEDCVGTLEATFDALGIEIDKGRLPGVVERNTFATRYKNRLQPRRRFITNNFYWRGQVGQWRTYLPHEQRFRMEPLTPLLMRLGYETDPEWWSK